MQNEQDAVADYLDRLNLQSLLLEHLTARMKVADSTERLKIAERLGRVYASMLADAKDATARDDLIKRSEELLKTVPQARAFDLRVNLLRQRYLVNEDLAERWRVRLADEPARAEAEKGLRAIRPQLDTLITELSKREESLQQGIDSDASTGDKLETELGLVRRWRSTAQYFNGWSAYYIAMLTSQTASTADALKAFGAILGGGDPGIEKLNREMLKYDHIARSAAGVALCESLQGHDALAMMWLDALRDEQQTPATVRDQLLRWRILVLAGARRWADVEREVRLVRAGGDVRPSTVNLPDTAVKGGGLLPPATARLLAVLAFEAHAREAGGITESLAKLAVGDLIARKEIASVVDLARKFGATALGSDGFVPQYVRGIQSYQEAIDAAKAAGKGIEEPMTDAALINRFGDAARLLSGSASGDDAREFPKERAQAMTMAGRALFLSGRLREAAEQFSAAAEAARDAADPAGAQEALWLAILSLDRAEKGNESGTDKLAVEERSEQLTTLFIKQFPGTDRAAQLTLRQIARNDRVDEEAVRVLQSVGKDSPVYDASRRQLARLLYKLFRAAVPADRAFASGRYLRVADPILAVDKKAALEARGEAIRPAAEKVLVTARQMLDAVLGVPAPDTAKAESVVGVIQQILFTTGVDMKPFVDELALRQVQIALAKGDLAAADKAVEQIRSRMDAARQGTPEYADARRFHVAARRVLLQSADHAFRAATTDDAKLAAAERVLKHGVPVLDEIGASSQAMNDAAVLATYGRVAEAGATLWRLGHKVEARDVAIRMDKAVLVIRPSLAENLARLGELSEAAGDAKTALESWRSLAGGAEAGSVQWAHAKYEFFRLLLASDAEAGKTALQQHLVLHPAGPEPWHGKIVELGSQHGVPASPPQAPVPNGVPPK